MWKIKLIWVVIMMALVATGCLRDDLSDCDQGIGLIFEYTHHNYETDLFGAEVKQVTVFAFDNDGNYVNSFPASVNRELFLPLSPGSYTLITLGGTLDSYSTGEINTLENFRLQIRTDDTKQDESMPHAVHPSHLYFNQKKVEIVYGRKQSETISLIKNSSTIRCRIQEIKENLSITAGSEENNFPYTIHLSGNNTTIDSNNNIPADAPLYRYPHISIEIIEPETLYQAEYTMMRLMKNHPVILKMEDNTTGAILLEENLLDLIFQHQELYTNQSDLDKEDLFLIELDINRGPSAENINITVRINGWTVTKLKPVF